MYYTKVVNLLKMNKLLCTTFYCTINNFRGKYENHFFLLKILTEIKFIFYNLEVFGDKHLQSEGYTVSVARFS